MELSLSAARAPSGAGEPLDSGAVPTVSGTLGMGLTKVPPAHCPRSQPARSFQPPGSPSPSSLQTSHRGALDAVSAALELTTLPLFSSFLFSFPFPILARHLITSASLKTTPAPAKSLAPHTPNPCPRVPFVLRHSTGSHEAASAKSPTLPLLPNQPKLLSSLLLPTRLVSKSTTLNSTQ